MISAPSVQVTASKPGTDNPARVAELATDVRAAVAHHQAGRLDEAETLYRKLLDAVPNHPRVLHLLGALETGRGHPARAVELIGQAFPGLARLPEAHVDFGHALRLARKHEEAVESYRRAIALKPDYALAHFSLAGVLNELGRFEAAVSHCRTAIAIHPKAIPPRIVLAVALKGAGRLPEAAQAWREIIDLEPERGLSYYQLAGQLISLGLFNEAVYCADRAIALQPDSADFHCMRGSALMRLYDGERAEASFRRAVALSPDYKEGWSGLSWTLRMLGRFDEADQCVKRLREIDPTDQRAVRHIPSTGQQPREAAEIKRLAAVLDRPDCAAQDRIAAGFALGRLLDDAGRFDEAFARYAAANALVRQNWPQGEDRFDAEAFTHSVDTLIRTNTPQLFAEAAAHGNISQLPVFIVGMPRSGTTLVEQICASHSRVFGAGERDTISRIALALARERRDPSKLAEASRRLADAHIVELHRLGRGALRVVDKLPDNVVLVGLIARLFPRARIVYCSRDPRDISLSCYFQLFTEGAQYFSYDLVDCGRRCRDVQRLAVHWVKLLPLHMIEINYETLVADLEGESRRLIEFLELDWEPACLDFHRTERTVATVSHWQVRQPLYSSSIGRWRHYEKHLAPLFAALSEPQECRQRLKPIRDFDDMMQAQERDTGSTDRLLQDAVAAYSAGKFGEAEALCRGILKQQPDHVASLQVLAAVAGQSGVPRRGIELLQKVINLQPGRADGHIQLAKLLRLEGQVSEAVAALKTAIDLEPGSAAAYNDLGLIHLDGIDVDEALRCFSRAIELSPDLAIAHYNRGLALERKGLYADAVAAFRQAIAIAPDFVEAQAKLGNLLLCIGNRAEGLASFRRAAKSDSGVGLMCQAKLLIEEEKTAAAEEPIRRAIDRNPQNSDAHCLLGTVLMELGRFDEAAAAFDLGIALNRRQIAAYDGLVHVKKLCEADRPLIAQMEWMLKEYGLADAERANLHLALGKAYDDLHDYQQAIRHFDEGNRLKRRTDGAYVAAEHAARIDRIIATFTADFFSRNAALGSDWDVPILIVGMPRSGTTLVEQILSSHPEIAAGGELAFWGEQASHFGMDARGRINLAWLNAAARDYRALLNGVSPTARRVTDKRPQNFYFIGLIHSAFPRARIIHCRRHPVDTCLSIYFQNFAGKMDFAYDRGDLLSVYRQYLRLMAHWRNVLPINCFLEIQYEELVADREAIGQKMIKFCGLDWNDACLHSEHNRRPVRTASMWQARQPVYRTSVARWRHYEPWLGALRELLPDAERNGVHSR